MRNAQLNIARHSTRTLALVIALLLVATACDRSHDGNLDESFETQLTDLVTYTGLDSDNHAMFRLEGRDDAPAIDLFTTVGEPQRWTCTRECCCVIASTTRTRRENTGT